MKIVYDIKNGDYIESEKGEAVHFYYKYDIKAIEKAFEFGLEEAWEAIKKILSSTDKGGLPTPAIKEMFGNSYLYPEDIFEKYSAEEVIKKIKEYEEKKMEEGERIEYLKHEDIKKDGKTIRVWYGGNDSRCAVREKKENVQFPVKISEEVNDRYKDRYSELMKEAISKTFERMNKNKSEEEKEKGMKTGDKFIIEIGDRLEKIAFPNGQFQLTGEYYNIKGTFAMISEREYENLKKYDEEGIKKEGYEKGLNEAWEIAKKISMMDYSESVKIFGSKFEGKQFWKHYSAAEAIQKIKEYEEKKKEEEVKVGDEIQSSEQTEKAVVLSIGADGYWGCLQNNSFFTVNDKQKKYWKKTGKHYDEVEKIFQKLKESEGEIPFL